MDLGSILVELHLVHQLVDQVNAATMVGVHVLSAAWVGQGVRIETRAGIAHLRGSRFVERTYPEARHELFNEVNADDVIAEVAGFIRHPVTARDRRSD